MRLEIQEYDGDLDHLFGGRRQILLTLSERNLRAILSKLKMPGSALRIDNGDCYRDGEPVEDYVFTLSAEDDETHYSHPLRSLKGQPGPMHPDTEAAIEEMQRADDE